MNTKGKYLELIHRDIDRILEPTERLTLDRYLAESEEGRTMHRELSEVTKFLGQVKFSEPPTNLKKRILNSIPPTRYSKQPADNFLSSIFGLGRPTLKFTYAFAAGLIAGLALFSVFREIPNLDDSRLTGTLFLSQSVDDLKTVDKVEMSQNQVSGTLEAKLGSEFVSLQLGLDADSEMSIEVKFDSEALSIRSFNNLDTSVTGVEFGTGFVKLKGSHVASRILFIRRSKTLPPIEVRIYIGSNVINRSVSIGPAEQAH